MPEARFPRLRRTGNLVSENPAHRELDSRKLRAQRGSGQLPRPFEAGVSRLAGGRSGLADLLVARRRVLRTHGDRRTDLVELEVVRLGAVLDQIDLVLGVAGVGHPLNPHALVGVVAGLGDVKRLVDVTAVGLLLGLLGDPSPAVPVEEGGAVAPIATPALAAPPPRAGR